MGYVINNRMTYNTPGPWLVHFFRSAKLRMNQIRSTEVIAHLGNLKKIQTRENRTTENRRSKIPGENKFY